MSLPADGREISTKQSGSKAAGTENIGIAESRGDYIALMDADDISLPERLEAQLTFLENNRDIMILGTTSQVIDREGRVTGRFAAMPGSPAHYQAKLLLQNLEFCNSSAMIRKSFMEDRHLSYREEYFVMQDYRFFMEASKLGAISCLADVHHRYRLHDGQISGTSRRTHSAERAGIYNRIRCDSLRMSGVRLREEDALLLGRLLPEDGPPVWNRQERQQLTSLFTEIREQLAAGGFPAIRELDEILFSILNH